MEACLQERNNNIENDNKNAPGLRFLFLFKTTDAMEGHPDKGIEIGNICDGGIRLGEDTMEGHPDERGQYLSRISVFLEKASYHDIQV